MDDLARGDNDRAGGGIEVLPRLENWRTAQDFAKETLRRAILRGELSGGTRLIQADLASQLGVSTTPVREALRDLAGAGLITLDRNRGGTVRELNWREVAEIIQIQEQLRPLVLRLAVQAITDDELRDAEALVDQMEQEEDLANWIDLNLRFHYLFHQAAGGGRLTEIVNSLEEAKAQYVAQAQRWHPEIRQAANHDHRALVAACRSRDVDAAAAAIVGHSAMAIEMTDEEERLSSSAGTADGEQEAAKGTLLKRRKATQAQVAAPNR